MGVNATPLLSSQPFAFCHLETDASLNMRRFRTLEDDSREFFAGGGVVLRTISTLPIRYEAAPLSS